MASGEGPRRLLPPWMVRVRPTDEASKSGSEAKCKKNGLEVLPREVCHPSSVGENEQRPAEAAICQSESTKTDSVSLKKCKAARGRKKLAKRAEDSDNNMHEGDVEKENHAPSRRRRSAKVSTESISDATEGDVEKVNHARPRRKRSAKVSVESSSDAIEGDVEKENHAPSRRKRKAKVSVESSSNAVEESTRDEDKLTVEDMISIAKEYINAEEGLQRQRLSSSAEHESEIPLPPFFPEDKPIHENPNPSSNSIRDISTSEASSSGLARCPPIERGVVSSSEPEDFALDIIDLFLGGMLKRSKTVEQNHEPVTESLRLDYAPSNPTRDGPVRAESLKLDYAPSNPTRDGPVRALDPVHKKKGSLKDKVAMLLS